MISAVVLTFNEENLIEPCLKSLFWVDELIVIDQGSLDKTLDIAKKYTDKIFVVKEADYSLRRNEGMKKAVGEWVLYVDADERVLKPLKDEIESIITFDNPNSAYAISRKNIIFGTPVAYGPYKKDWMIRLFKKADFETWVGKVHEYGKFKGDLGYTKNSLLHLTHRDVDHIVLKSLEWSKIDAQLRFDVNHPPMSSWRFLRIFITETFNQGVRRGGFFAGTVGVMDSLMQVFSLIITYIRLWQLQQGKSLSDIYKDIDKKLIEKGFEWEN